MPVFFDTACITFAKMQKAGIKIVALWILMFQYTFSAAQNTPPSSYYLNDSIIDLRINHPEFWVAESTKVAEYNKHFLDSMFSDSNIYEQLFYPRFAENISNEGEGAITLEGVKWNNNKRWNWAFVITVFTLGMTATLKLLVKEKIFISFFLSFFSRKYCEQVIEEEEISPFINALVALISAISFSLLLVSLLDSYHIDVFHLKLLPTFMLLLLLFSVYFLVKIVLYLLISSLLETQGIYRVITQISLSGNFVTALFFIPFFFVVDEFTFLGKEDLLYALSISSFLFIIFKQVRIALQGMHLFPYTTFYLFLYLCALEIAPWAILISWVYHQFFI